MTGLLVSVRDAEEALIALRGGADIIDVKEPRNGSLGAADSKVWRAVHERIAGRAPLSAALGELASCVVRGTMKDLDGYRFAKFGLAGCQDVAGWPQRWRATLSLLPAEVAPVAVAYADFEQARAPDPSHVLAQAMHFKCAALLLDTFEKSNGDLFDYLTPSRLSQLIQQARNAGLLVVLAGSLSSDSIVKAVKLSPDYVAVRGAVCRGDRSAGIDQQLVRRLRDRVTFAQQAAQIKRVCQANS